MLSCPVFVRFCSCCLVILVVLMIKFCLVFSYLCFCFSVAIGPNYYCFTFVLLLLFNPSVLSYYNNASCACVFSTHSSRAPSPLSTARNAFVSSAKVFVSMQYQSVSLQCQSVRLQHKARSSLAINVYPFTVWTSYSEVSSWWLA